jgi:hypothetical protein
MKMFCCPCSPDLKVIARVRVRLFPDPDAEDVARLRLHCEFWMVPDPPKAPLPAQPLPLSALRYMVPVER